MSLRPAGLGYREAGGRKEGSRPGALSLSDARREKYGLSVSHCGQPAFAVQSGDIPLGASSLKIRILGKRLSLTASKMHSISFEVDTR